MFYLGGHLKLVVLHSGEYSAYSKEQSTSTEANVAQLVKKFPAFYEPQVSLPHLQVPTTSPYPQPDQSSPCPPPFHFLKISQYQYIK